MAKRNKHPQRASTVLPLRKQTRDASGATVAAMKDIVSAGAAAVNAVKTLNAVALNAMATECAEREGIDPERFNFNIDLMKWEEKR